MWKFLSLTAVTILFLSFFPLITLAQKPAAPDLVCFMITSSGQEINLSDICGEQAQDNYTRIPLRYNSRVWPLRYRGAY